MENYQLKNAFQNVHHHNQVQQSNSNIYTHQLPYAIRRDVCKLLDADKSWRTLGGQYFGLDATELTLIGHAYLRQSSPTEELLNKMDSVNLRICELGFYLQQMNHWRALEILKPHLIDITRLVDDEEIRLSAINRHLTSNAMLPKSDTLHTPTPSFAGGQPVAIMGIQEELNTFDNIQPWPEAGILLTESDQNQNKPIESLHQHIVDNRQPTKCHRSSNEPPSSSLPPFLTTNNTATATATAAVQQQIALLQDPGEEIVRMACANNRKRTSISDQEVVNQLRLIMQIRYNELKQASDDFSDINVLGNGGFASVYRGNWKGTEVAIKRLKCNLMDQALNELTILNSYRIDNILPIYGISIDGPEACLVYQFMANGSLEDRISCKQNTPPLTWQQRALIGEGVAKGLCYLHTLRDKPLVHGDVKSANVLLDSQFIPKLGDFGLARQVFKGQNAQSEFYTHCTVSSIHGTSVYLPPEYLRHKILSPAVDVYSYGIVLLEMATGKRAYDGKRLLIDVVEEEIKSLSEGKICYNLRDARLPAESQVDLSIWYDLLVKLGLNCAQRIKKKRLDMRQVLDRFLNFRTNNDLGRAGSVSPAAFYPLVSAAASTTTRNTTQQLPQQSTAANQPGGGGDVMLEEGNLEGNPAFCMQNNQFLNIATAAAATALPTNDYKQQYETFAANNSALMSVEEGAEMKYFNLDHQPPTLNQVQSNQQIQVNQNAPESTVEAMIPLLTELGLSPEQD